MITIEELISKAELALGASGPVDNIYSCIADYSETFADWQRAGGVAIAQADKVQALERLEGLHSAILKKVEGLQADTRQDLRDTKVRGKGIMAYIDVLPRKISVRRPRKG